MNFFLYLGLCIVTANFAAAITCGSNENEVECLQNCTFDSCPTSQDETNVCTNNTGSDCQPGCKCAFNYRLDDNGNCIPTTDCPPFDCPGVNERYDPCPPYCSDNCGNIKSDGTCNIIGHIGVRLECFPDCRCKTGYARQNGICKPITQCPTS